MANLFRPRIVICAVILTSANKWDIEPGQQVLYSSRYGKIAVKKIAVKNSDGTVKMYQAAQKYFEALKSASSDKYLEVLKEKLDVLQGI